LDDKEYAKFVKNVERAGLTKTAYLRILISKHIPQEKPQQVFWSMLEEFRNFIKGLEYITRNIGEDKADIKKTYEDILKLYYDLYRKIFKANIEPEKFK
jgi:hypothetical protein